MNTHIKPCIVDIDFPNKQITYSGDATIEEIAHEIINLCNKHNIEPVVTIDDKVVSIKEGFSLSQKIPFKSRNQNVDGQWLKITNATEGTPMTHGTTEQLCARWYAIGYEACKREHCIGGEK